ncbi:unnamed protein product [Mortierella alpina]
MSETVVLSYVGIQNHLNRFQTLQAQLDGQSQEQTAGQAQVQAQEGLTRRELLEAINMPRSPKISEQQSNCIAHTRKLVKYRQRALEMPVNASVSEALERISTKEAPLKNAATWEHVHSAFAIQKRNPSVLRALKGRRSLQKQCPTKNGDPRESGM